RRDGEECAYVFSAASRGQGMGEGTGIPAALGAMLMETGRIRDKGVFPPERGVDPVEMFALLKEKVEIGGEGGLSMLAEHIAADGGREEIDLFSLVSSLMPGPSSR
ncbi:MAG: hypothetical protein ACE5LQ_03540, partial [Candidatus Bipolaricaulia bacterium]